MSVEYCTLCGLTHKVEDRVLCNQLQEERVKLPGSGMTTRRMATSAKLTAGKELEAETIEDEMSCTSGTLEERERRARVGIEELEAELRVTELEERFEDLKLERQRRRQRRRTEIKDGGEAQMAAAAVPAISQPSAIVPWGAVGVDQHDDFGTIGRSRLRTREEEAERPRTRTDSSATRRRRSKWSLKNYTIGGKEVRKLNGYELLGSTMLWCLDIPELSRYDYRAIIQHMHFICNRARDDHFKDCAHTEYDSAIRKMAEFEGFAAFSRRNAGESIVHYGTQNSRPVTKSKGSGYVSTTRKKSPGGPAKGACYAWNGEAGCTRSEEECRFTHICSKCGSKSHKRYKCKE